MSHPRSNFLAAMELWTHFSVTTAGATAIAQRSFSVRAIVLTTRWVHSSGFTPTLAPSFANACMKKKKKGSDLNRTKKKNSATPFLRFRPERLGWPRFPQTSRCGSRQPAYNLARDRFYLPEAPVGRFVLDFRTLRPTLPWTFRRLLRSGSSNARALVVIAIICLWAIETPLLALAFTIRRYIAFRCVLDRRSLL